MNKELQTLLSRIAGATTLFILALAFREFPIHVQLPFFFGAYLTLAYDVIIKGVERLFKGKILGEHILMTLATLGAFALGEYPEAVAVMFFYQVGEAISAQAASSSRSSIRETLNLKPDVANVLRRGRIYEVNPAEVQIGDILVIRPGERIALDATITKGSSLIDTKPLTGESLPREVGVGDELVSGTINLEGLLHAEVNSLLENSTAQRIIDLIEHSGLYKASTDRLITQFAKYYTPLVVFTAILIGFIMPSVLPGLDFKTWSYRALVFLVVSCPCALLISVPLTYFAGIGGASRAGIIVKGESYLEALSQAKKYIFDKTGTLTKGSFELVGMQRFADLELSDEELGRLVAYVESHSTHPIALSLHKAFEGDFKDLEIEDLKELPGRGVSAIIDGRHIAVGRLSFVKDHIDSYALTSKEVGESELYSSVYVALDGVLAARYDLSDKERQDALPMLEELRDLGIKETLMLSGDKESIVLEMAKKLGIPKAYGGLLPDEKVYRVKEELEVSRAASERLAAVGDGVNDAPMLKISDVGIAMGAFGSKAAIEASDVIIMTNDLMKIPAAVRISKRTRSIAVQNIAGPISVKVAVLILASVGFSSIWAGVFADVGVTFLAVLNASRALAVDGQGYPKPTKDAILELLRRPLPRR